jgi:hypothetical protein
MISDVHRNAFRSKFERLLLSVVPQLADRAALRDAETRLGRPLDEREQDAFLDTLHDGTRPRWMPFEMALRSRAPELAELLTLHPLPAVS